MTPIAIARAALTLCLPALAGCTRIDGDQARLCRIAVPALEAPGTAIAVQRIAAAERGVRVTYRATPRDRETLERFAECRFAIGRRTDIDSITTDRGEVPGATVYLLRRYYVETPEGIAADPRAPATQTRSPAWPSELALVMALLIASLRRLNQRRPRG